MIKVKKITMHNAGKDVEQLELLYLAHKDVNSITTLGVGLTVSFEGKHMLSLSDVTPHLLKRS